MVVSSTVNGHVRWKRVPIQCQPSHSPDKAASTTTSDALRRTARMRSEYHSCRVAPMPLDPSRTVAELQELRELTGDENGAQRVAWTDTWATAREWLRGKLDGLPLEHELDQAGNQWWTLRGASERSVLIGGHIDSVPNGGWLDGCLNLLAGVEVLRRLAEEGEPATTVRLVNWADEEGARFGRSLFGSSAAAGSMRDQDELRALQDRRGIALPDAPRRPGIVTSVVETAEQLLDQRHLDADKLASMLAAAQEASERFAGEEDVEVAWERIWSIEPILFDETLIGFAEQAVREVSGTSHRLPSGPLHDAAEVSRAGVPTVMLFVQSLRGLSHTKLEDTKPEHLELSVAALDRLASRTIAWAAG